MRFLGRGHFANVFKPVSPTPMDLNTILVFVRFVASKDGDDVLHRNDEQLVVVLEVNGNGVLRMKEDLVVLSKRQLFVVFHHRADRDDASRDRRPVGSVSPLFSRS